MEPGDESDGHYRNAGGGHKAFCGQSPGGKGVRWDPYRGVFLYRRGDRSRISRNPLKDRISTASDHASGFSEQAGGLFKHRDPGAGTDGDHGGPWKGRGLWTEQRV